MQQRCTVIGTHILFFVWGRAVCVSSSNRGREVLVLAVSLRWHRKEHDLLGATLTSAPRTPVTFTLLLRRYLLPEPIPCPNAKQKPRRTSSTSKRNRDEDESSFEKVSRKWWAWWSISKSPRQAETLMNRLEADVFPTIGNLPTDAVLTTHIRDTMLTIETRGARDVAKRSNQFIGQIVRFAIARELASRNPAADFRPRDVLAATESENFAHVDEKYLPDLLVKTDGYNGDSWTERRDD